jgi:hypothetical protein
MSPPFDLILRGTLVLPDALLPGGYVAMRGQTIAAIGQGEPPEALRTVDHGTQLILPGLVDQLTPEGQLPQGGQLSSAGLDNLAGMLGGLMKR